MPSAVREMMEVTDEGIAMADSDVNLNMNNCDDGCATFDVQRFLRGLDAIFDAHKAPKQNRICRRRGPKPNTVIMTPVC